MSLAKLEQWASCPSGRNRFTIALSYTGALVVIELRERFGRTDRVTRIVQPIDYYPTSAYRSATDCAADRVLQKLSDAKA